MKKAKKKAQETMRPSSVTVAKHKDAKMPQCGVARTLNWAPSKPKSVPMRNRVPPVGKESM